MEGGGGRVVDEKTLLGGGRGMKAGEVIMRILVVRGGESSGREFDGTC